MAQGIIQLSISRDGGDYLLNIEDEDGETTEFALSYEQLDLLSEAIDEHLDADEEESLSVDDDDGQLADGS